MDLRHSHLSGIEIIGGGGLSRANIALSCLFRINFVNLSLEETNFYRCNLVRAGLLSCDLSRAHLGAVRAIMCGARGTGARHSSPAVVESPELESRSGPGQSVSGRCSAAVS
ncbi:pentapeptide repeat-containing protein [Streptomyces collinus]